ncbi:permease [Neobacillus massiliamazoniensis]|uniref:Permease protein, putative n=1 Tax=Neobacillus massiliamazoniensis TaxID=1499688 RepID=A0A0U1NRX9_9BACI|nr:permease [Neobacillus massiliamazoniensis]CRK80811.1 permease protein, putative [Neobacillus massiliamazoniensis]
MINSSPTKDTFVYGLFLFIVYLFFFGNDPPLQFIGVIFQGEWRTIFVVFLGILLEALPFIVIGALMASVIQILITEEIIQRFIPKRPIPAMIIALILSAMIPVCECAIIPVVRRLIQKGVPVHAGIVLLICAPIMNFVVFGSTFYAFQRQPDIFYGRIILCVMTALIAGTVIYVWFNNKNILKLNKGDLTQHRSFNQNRGTSKLKGVLHHTCKEFFAVGKVFIIGASIASIAQVYVPQSMLIETAKEPIKSTIMMMGIAFILSLCSEADAFVAASLGHAFLPSAILGFLVYGPILDIKNVFLMLSSFKVRFVLLFFLVITITVFSLSLLAGYTIMRG